MSLLKTGMKIGKAEVIVDIVPKGNPEVRPGRKIKPTHITYHNTGNSSKGANAKSHNNYIHNLAKKSPEDTSHVSWHLTVDEDYIYQHLPLDENAWHCGDGSGPKSGNMTSIGIEICEHVDQKNYHQAEENAIALGVYLAKQLGIPESNHVPHQRWSGKFCPRVILKRDGGFTKFHNRIKAAIKNNSGQVSAPKEIKKEESVKVPEPTGKPIGTAKILVANLNVRAEASFSAKIVDVVNKDQVFNVYETKNGLHRIKNGWISAGAKYTKFTSNSGAVSSGSDNAIGTAEILVDMLNIRQDASFSSKIVGVARKGQEFDVFETKNGLHRIKSGWISAGTKYAKFTKKSAPKKVDNRIGTVEILVNMLNIRSGPSFDSGVVGIARKGEIYNVYEAKGGLYRIGDGRWISAGSKYTKFKQIQVGSIGDRKGDMKTNSIVDYLKSINVDSSFNNRKRLAEENGIKGYTGTAAQNALLLKKLRGH